MTFEKKGKDADIKKNQKNENNTEEEPHGSAPSHRVKGPSAW